MAVADGSDRPEVFERDGLAPAAVVRDRHHHERDPLGAVLGEGAFENVDVDVALEGHIGLEVGRLGARDVEGDPSLELHVGARGVEVRVVGDDVAGLDGLGEENALRRPPLVRRDDVALAGEIADHGLEAFEGSRPGVRLVADHHPCPLLGRHRPGAGVGEEVDQDLVGAEPEQVPSGLGEGSLSLLPRREPERLDGLDTEGLDDRAVRHALRHYP